MPTLAGSRRHSAACWRTTSMARSPSAAAMARICVWGPATPAPRPALAPVAPRPAPPAPTPPPQAPILRLGTGDPRATSRIGSGGSAACPSRSDRSTTAGRGAGLGFGELLISSGVGEAVLENETGHAVPLEPDGHLCAL